MTALAEKLKRAGYDTFEARFAVLATEAIRAHPHSVVEAWKLIGEKFGFEYLRERMKDMKGGKAERSPPNPLAVSNPAICSPKPYTPRIISKERVEQRRRQADAVRSKFKNSGGIYWSEVGWHELFGLARDGVEANALLAAGPANVPNDGRTVGNVLGAERIDKIIKEVRAQSR